MATAKKKASKPAARRRSAAKPQVNRQRAQPDSGTPETNEPQNDQSEDLPPVEGSAYSQEELLQLEHDARVTHNARTGGGAVQPGELELQRLVHNARTGGVSREEIEKELAPTGFKF